MILVRCDRVAVSMYGAIKCSLFTVLVRIDNIDGLVVVIMILNLLHSFLFRY